MKRKMLGLGAFAVGVCTAAGLGAAGCGARVLVDRESGEGGAGGQGGGPTTTTSVTTSTTTSVTTTTTTSVTTSTTTSTSTGTTTTTPTLPPEPTLIEVPLGKLPLDQPFAFEVPPNTLGFTLVANVPNNPSSPLGIGVDKMWAPDGTELVKDYTLGPENSLFFYASIGIISAGVPQSDDPQAMPAQVGKWTAQIGDYEFGGPANADVSVYLRQTIDGQFHGGVLDVNVFLVEGVATPDQLKTTIAGAYNGYVGLNLGELNFYSLPSQYDIIDETNFYQALNETSVISNKPALNVLYVSLLGGQLNGAAGVSSGLPGAAVVHGSNASGIIAMYFDDDFDTTILRHEGGHFGGLFHTTEFDPGNSDFLSDTPVCDDVINELEGCPDYDNIMFPTGGSGLGFSPKQIQVLQSSALYRGVFQPGAAPSEPFLLAPPPSGSSSLPWLGSWSGEDLPDAAPYPGVAPSQAPWASGLGMDVANALGGLVCPHGAGGLPAAWNATISGFAGVPDGALLAIARDAAAPSHVRTRAVTVLGERKISDATIADLADIAASEGVPSVVRVSAVQAVSRTSPAARGALKLRLGGDAGSVVGRVAKRLL